MPTPLARARRTLLRRLLEKHERSRAFGQPGPWRQDAIVRIDAREFPEAFAPEGRETLGAVRGAAEELALAGAVRLIRHRGLAGELPHELRLGPGELGRAYELAVSDGFVPLADSLEALGAHARSLRTEPVTQSPWGASTGPPSPPALARAPGDPGHGSSPAASHGVPEWMGAFLARVEAGAAAADLSVIGIARDRLKREQRDVLDALTAAVALARGASGWERVVSERVFRDSKRLGAIRSRVVDLLLRSDPRWLDVPADEATDLLEAYGVRRRPALIRCAGVASLDIAGRRYQLDDFTPTAHLPASWAEAWVNGVSTATPACVTTIENEYPFLAYVEESGGPAALGARGELVVYTAGFPAPALVDALAGIAARIPGATLRHWGDADLGGLRIWWLLRRRLARRVDLFRTQADWLEETTSRDGGTPLSEGERRGLDRLRAELATAPFGGEPDLAEAQRLIAMLLERGVKVEQERY